MKIKIQYHDNLGFLDLLILLFIGLKLTNNIDWSWWWVLSPFLIPLSLSIIALFLSDKEE